MEILEAIKNRHSVRQYTNKEIESNIIETLQQEIEKCNQEGNMHIQLVTNEPKAFDSFRAHYGKFNGVNNYIVLIGKKEKQLDEKCGYYGERLVLLLQSLGLNSCWVAMTYKKIPSAFTISKGEKLTVVISFGYGKTQGNSHKIKTITQVSNVSKNTPEWFKKGVEATLLAPTAMNQQKFKIIYENDKVIFEKGIGFYSKVDLGIVKYHFEIGSGKKVH